MTLFGDIPSDSHPPTRSRRGWTLLLIAAAAVVGLSVLPTPYVIQQPGGTFDTLGQVTIDDREVDMISIAEETTYPTTGQLRMLTVGVVGDRTHPVSWLSVAQAWFDRSKAVLPIDSVYPNGQTVEESTAENQMLMDQSREEATAAALRELGYAVPTEVVIDSIVPDSPAAAVLAEGDAITEIAGQMVEDAQTVQRAVVSAEPGTTVTLTVMRAGEALSFEVTPASGFAAVPVIGVSLRTVYDFPFPVTIQLQNVGGPSAGMMFALGIIDKLTPEDETGGLTIAGTGTMTASGEVGPIGGIRQKLFGAQQAGATWFLAPADNCAEVVGHVPDGMGVVRVETLSDARTALDRIREGSTADLPTCS